MKKREQLHGAIIYIGSLAEVAEVRAQDGKLKPEVAALVAEKLNEVLTELQEDLNSEINSQDRALSLTRDLIDVLGPVEACKRVEGLLKQVAEPETVTELAAKTLREA